MEKEIGDCLIFQVYSDLLAFSWPEGSNQIVAAGDENFIARARMAHERIKDLTKGRTTKSRSLAAIASDSISNTITRVFGYSQSGRQWLLGKVNNKSAFPQVFMNRSFFESLPSECKFQLWFWQAFMTEI